MDGCAETRELLETAALEPDGIGRLEAGDTAEAARAAGHLAVCPPCAEELARLRRAAATLRAVLAAGPSPALREQTLALVRAAGVERPRAEAGVLPAAGAAEAGAPLPVAVPARPSRLAAGTAWLAAAAVLVVAAFGAGFAVGSPAGPATAPTAAPYAALAQVAGTQARVMSATDAVEVILRDPAGVPRGMLATAPSTGEMVVVASGLDPAPAGSSYRCWAEVAGKRQSLGTMYLTGDAAWWAGPAVMAGPIAPGTRFGVSLVDAAGSGAEPVLVGAY